MAAITWLDIVAYAPELSGVQVSIQNDLLALVEEQLSSEDFGGEDSTQFKLARIYLVAHMCLTQTDKSPIVTSESVGGISRSYYVSDSPSFFESTPYGRLFLSLNPLSKLHYPIVI